jgi:YD repeat-containing protein
MTYNALGLQGATVDKLGRSTRFEYDDLGRLVKTIYPDGTTEEMTYDAEGRRLTFKDRADRVTGYVYDPLGRLVRTTFPDNTFVTNSYDAAGRLAATTDGRGKKTVYEYDAAGRRTKLTDPLGNETTFEYDRNGNQISFTDPNGQITSYGYDALNRRIKTTFPDGIVTTTTYDKLGRRIGGDGPGGKTTRFEYDRLGRLVKVDALTRDDIRYDEVGNFVSQTDANRHTTRFEYDAPAGRPNGRFRWESESQTYDGWKPEDAHGFQRLMTSYQYDEFNDWLALRQYPDGSQYPSATRPAASACHRRGETLYTYDLRDRLEEPDLPRWPQTGICLRPKRNRTPDGDHRHDGPDDGHAYDDASRLDTVTDPDRIPDYGYDANGNRTLARLPQWHLNGYDYYASTGSST